MAKNSMSSSHRLDKRERERERERKALEIKKKKLMQFSQCDQTDPDKLQALKNRKMERVSSNVGVKHESAKKKKKKKRKEGKIHMSLCQSRKSVALCGLVGRLCR
jgi:hypothetical protein